MEEYALPQRRYKRWAETDKKLDAQYEKINVESFPMLLKRAQEIGIGNKAPERANTACYHDNRIVLPVLADSGEEDDSSYVNASWMFGKDYIAAAMPFNALTRQDFWRMVYEEQVRMIIMLNKESEAGNEAYWPNEMYTGVQYGPMRVSKLESMRMRFYGCIVRTFTVTRTDIADANTLQVKQYHYLDWPDKGVPEEYDELLEMCDYIEQERLQAPQPVIVHCYAGIGRTGVFLLIHMAMRQLQTGCPVNVYELLSDMRAMRPMMIQTRDQYKFCYRMVMELMDRFQSQQANPATKVLTRGLSSVTRGQTFSPTKSVLPPPASAS